MKTAYKLLSVFLDRKALPDIVPVVTDATYFDEIDDVCSERSLFDYPLCIRKVSAMFLLSQQCFEQIEMMIERIDCRMTLVALLDYHVNCVVANQLFIKRMLQMIEMIARRFSKVTVVLAAPTSELTYYRTLISAVFKENMGA